MILSSAVFGFGFALSQLCSFRLLNDHRSSAPRIVGLCTLRKRSVWCRVRCFCPRSRRVYAIWGVLCIPPVHHPVYGECRVSLDDIFVSGSTFGSIEYSMGLTKARCCRTRKEPLSEPPLPPVRTCSEGHSISLITPRVLMRYIRDASFWLERFFIYVLP